MVWKQQRFDWTEINIFLKSNKLTSNVHWSTWMDYYVVLINYTEPIYLWLPFRASVIVSVRHIFGEPYKVLF